MSQSNRDAPHFRQDLAVTTKTTVKSTISLTAHIKNARSNNNNKNQHKANNITMTREDGLDIPACLGDFVKKEKSEITIFDDVSLVLDRLTHKFSTEGSLWRRCVVPLSGKTVAKAMEYPPGPVREEQCKKLLEAARQCAAEQIHYKRINAEVSITLPTFGWEGDDVVICPRTVLLGNCPICFRAGPQGKVCHRNDVYHRRHQAYFQPVYFSLGFGTEPFFVPGYPGAVGDPIHRHIIMHDSPSEIWKGLYDRGLEEQSYDNDELPNHHMGPIRVNMALFMAQLIPADSDVNRFDEDGWVSNLSLALGWTNKDVLRAVYINCYSVHYDPFHILAMREAKRVFKYSDITEVTDEEAAGQDPTAE